MIEAIDTVIVGAGHAGLALSGCLTQRGISHTVLERGKVGQRWRTERWDSLIFQFPNWSLQLPGHAYSYCVTPPAVDGTVVRWSARSRDIGRALLRGRRRVHAAASPANRGRGARFAAAAPRGR